MPNEGGGGGIEEVTEDEHFECIAYGVLKQVTGKDNNQSNYLSCLQETKHE